MYDAIRAQPDRIAKLIARERDSIMRAGRAAASRRRIVFIGIGTSYYAALAAERFIRLATAEMFPARAEHSFEFLYDTPRIGEEDAAVVISHTGTTKYSVDAFQRARTAGALTTCIVGENPGPAMRSADFLVTTCEQEVAFTYTKSYSSALAALAGLAIEVAAARKLDVSAARAALAGLPNNVEAALAAEPAIRELARQAAVRDRMAIFGSGPHWITAQEAALKIKEASYLSAEGFETEQLLHGPFSEVDSRFSVVALLDRSSADARAMMLLRAAGELSALRAAIGPEEALSQIPAECKCVLPVANPWSALFIHLVAIQLLAYWLAIERGTSPDTGRLDQPAHARARTHYQF